MIVSLEKYLKWFGKYKDGFSSIAAALGIIVLLGGGGKFIWSKFFNPEVDKETKVLTNVESQISVGEISVNNNQVADTIVNSDSGLGNAQFRQLKALIIRGQPEISPLRDEKLWSVVDRRSGLLKFGLENKDISEELILLIKEGDIDAAEHLVDQHKFQSLDHKSVKLAQGYFDHGWVKSLKFKFEEALISFEKAIFLNPDDGASLYFAGVAAFELKQFDKAARYIEKTAKTHPDFSEYSRYFLVNIYRGMADKWLEEGEYERAIDGYQQSLVAGLKVYGENSIVSDIYGDIGFIYYIKRDFVRAVDNLEKELAIALKGKDALKIIDVRTRLGSYWSAKGDYKQSIGVLEIALADALTSVGEGSYEVVIIKLDLGLALLALGEYDKASDYLEELSVERLEEQGVQGYKLLLNIGLGYSWVGKQDFVKAISYFEKALREEIEIEGDGSLHGIWIHSFLAYVWRFQGGREKSMQYVEEVLASDFKKYKDEYLTMGMIHSNLMFVYLTLEQFANADIHFEQVRYNFEKEFGVNNVAVSHVMDQLNDAREKFKSSAETQGK